MRGRTYVLNVAGLVAGFVLGQGSMFLAQTWLVARDELAVVGAVGLGLALLSFAQWAVDWGGLVILSRLAATREDTGYLAAACVVRICVATVLFTAILGGTFAFADTELLRGVLLGGAASVWVWAFNITGYLDGTGHSRYSGPINSLFWLAASGGIVVMDVGRPFAAGATVGGLFLAGVIVAVSAQHLIARVIGRPVRGQKPSRADIISFTREGSLFCLAGVPAQLYGRVLIVIVAATLGAEMAGVYVYIRNILVAANQGVMFVKRVEFPRLAKAVQDGVPTVSQMLFLQSGSIAVSTLCYAALLVAILVLSDMVPERFIVISDPLILFGILIPVFGLSSAFSRMVVALERMGAYALVIWATLPFSIAAVLVFIENLGLSAIVFSEAGMYCAQIAIYFAIVRRIVSSAVQDSKL